MAPIPVLQSPLLSPLPGVRHAFFTRNGGTSHGVYQSLNVGRGSKDDPAAVEANRERAAAHFGVAGERLLTAYQIHSATAHVVDGPWPRAPEGDAIASRTSGLVLGALSADCAPILLVDAEAGVVACAHAGWRGALGGVIEAAVEAMRGLGADAARTVAAVGPCIGPASYEVGLEFLDRFAGEAPGSERFFAAAEAADKRLFDLPGFVLARLRGAGVTSCEWIGRDTCADEADFFSNRRAVKRGEGDYGRLLSAIMLESGS
ncbi:MAG: peptidoglycan editing factor PgeF [Caulobacteraceae bacterium]|nr:peptidoglycan editing factor PgeF [Caulobacteraceae bacterium]